MRRADQLFAICEEYVKLSEQSDKHIKEATKDPGNFGRTPAYTEYVTIRARMDQTKTLAKILGYDDQEIAVEIQRNYKILRGLI